MSRGVCSSIKSQHIFVGRFCETPVPWRLIQTPYKFSHKVDRLLRRRCQSLQAQDFANYVLSALRDNRSTVGVLQHAVRACRAIL